jgi:hypothetical protein
VGVAFSVTFPTEQNLENASFLAAFQNQSQVGELSVD